MFNGCTAIVDFLRIHQASLWLMGVLSIIVFIGTLVAIPLLVIHMPTDYFTRRRKPLKSLSQGHAAVRILVLVFKNLAGMIFILSGIMMLVLPGQGVISLLIGLMLVNFPGKRDLELRIIRQQTVFRALNWMRLRAQKPPLKLPRKRPRIVKDNGA